MAGCKRPVRVLVRDPWGGGESWVTGFYHPRGCMGARLSHLDLPAEQVSWSLLSSLAARGGARVSVVEVGGCYEIWYSGLSVQVCPEGLEASGGVGYVTSHRQGWIYLALPGLRPRDRGVRPRRSGRAPRGP